QIFTIGIGSTDGELLRIKDVKGRTDYIRDEQGNVVKSRLNQTLLQEIAGATRGVYFPLRGAKTMDNLYRDWLAPIPKSDAQETFVRRYHERFHWPLSLAILFLLVEMLLPERRREPRTKTALPAPAQADLREAVALLALLLLPATAFASSSSALREYKTGKYDQALK